MSKQREVTAHYNQRGYATSGDAYNRDMRKARLADESSTYHSAPVHHNPEFAAQLDKCIDVVCCGCFSDPDDTNPENAGSCCVIL